MEAKESDQPSDPIFLTKKWKEKCTRERRKTEEKEGGYLQMDEQSGFEIFDRIIF